MDVRLTYIVVFNTASTFSLETLN